uniref:G-protein coupled receptors family 1 profile domain-containing protein n=1 Tax=Oreochromis aureus TaxID=47969 RepID=A0A668W5S2_OREAU
LGPLSFAETLDTEYSKAIYRRRRDPGPAPYYIYLLVSNLIQLCAPILWLAKLEDHHQPTGVCGVFFFFGVTTSLNFKTCIVLERYFFITCPMLNFIRKTKGSILVSVLVWTMCVITIPLAILLHQVERIYFFTFYPAPLFILCLAGTLKALPAATSVPAEEKRRIIGTLFLLHLNYFVLVLPAVILLSFVRNVSLAMILLSPFVDLMLFCFMQKGPVDSLLSCLCSDVASDHQSETNGEKKEKQNVTELQKIKRI